MGETIYSIQPRRTSPWLDRRSLTENPLTLQTESPIQVGQGSLRHYGVQEAIISILVCGWRSQCSQRSRLSHESRSSRSRSHSASGMLMDKDAGVNVQPSLDGTTVYSPAGRSMRNFPPSNLFLECPVSDDVVASPTCPRESKEKVIFTSGIPFRSHPRPCPRWDRCEDRWRHRSPALPDRPDSIRPHTS